MHDIWRTVGVAVLVFCSVTSKAEVANQKSDQRDTFLQTVRQGNWNSAISSPNSVETIKSILIGTYGVKPSAFEGRDCPSAISSLLVNAFSFKAESIPSRLQETMNAIRNWCPKSASFSDMLGLSKQKAEGADDNPITAGLTRFLGDFEIALQEYQADDQRKAEDTATKKSGKDKWATIDVNPNQPDPFLQSVRSVGWEGLPANDKVNDIVNSLVNYYGVNPSVFNFKSGLDYGDSTICGLPFYALDTGNDFPLEVVFDIEDKKIKGTELTPETSESDDDRQMQQIVNDIKNWCANPGTVVKNDLGNRITWNNNKNGKDKDSNPAVGDSLKELLADFDKAELEYLQEHHPEIVEQAAVNKRRHECLSSNKYLAWEDEQIIIDRRNTIVLAKKAIAHDKEVEKVSGVSDLALRHEAGSELTNAQKSLESVFKEYKSLGGEASSPDKVKDRANPCDE